jgi:hypothetical protein
MPQLLATLWTPAIWIKAMKERQATFAALFNSGTVIQSDLMDGIANGAGTSANIPFLKDITDQDDEVQVEANAPVNDQGAPGDVQNFPILNRVTKNSATALAATVSGADPITHVIESLTARRLKQRQKTLIAMLRGLLGTALAVNSAAALTAVRYGGTVAEPFTENGVAAAEQYLMTPDLFIKTKALMGELQDTLKNGCLLMHPDIKARLEILDALSFRTTIKPSELPFDITTYRDIPLFLSNSLVRAGQQSGFVYDTYLVAKGTVGYGEKPQASDVKDTASLAYFYDRDLNDDLIWDRSRFLMGVDGTSWIGEPASQSAANAELQNVANWKLVYQTANRCGVTAIRTNG